MKVMASDLVPVKPFETAILNLGMGQRYDIIVTADQSAIAGNFWIRAIPQSACSDNAHPTNIKGIVYYGDSPSTPDTAGYSYTDGCDDETFNLAPYVSKDVSGADWTALEEATVASNSAGLFKWYLNNTTMLVEWGSPTIQTVLNRTSDFSTSNAAIELSTVDQWVYFVINTTLAVPHPIHLHGYDFFDIGQGTGAFSSSVSLNTTNPARRGTAMLPASGFLVLAWQTDNPGVWPMHCHIGWHTEQGFAFQFIEREGEIAGISNSTYVNNVCTAWDTFQSSYSTVQDDSGI